MLPPVSVLVEPVRCFPAWHTTFKKYGGRQLGVVSSGCKTVDGNVQCDPEAMARAASAKVGFPVSLEAYTLARYFASEVGSGTVEEKVAVAQAAMNRAVYVERLPRGILDLLLYRQKPGHPNRGYYGPIHGPSGVSTAPYGRWAATSRDPTYGDLVLAVALLEGTFDGFNKGADDQMGPEYLKDPVGSVRYHGSRRDYWVGPLPGVNPWHTFLYRHLPDVAPGSELGRYLIERGVAAMKSSKPSWLLTPVCSTDGAVPSKLRQLAPAVGAFVFVGLGSFVTIGLLGKKRGLLGNEVGAHPDDWWKQGRRDRSNRLCYRTKSSALQAFRDANQDTIQAWGGLDASSSPAEFDAINHKYGLRGRKAVRTLARALWVAMPNQRPYCLDRMDLDALNETSPGQAGSGFRLPGHAVERVIDREQERHYRAERDRERESKMRRAIDAAFDRALAKRGMKPDDVPF